MSCDTASVMQSLAKERKRLGWTQEYLSSLSGVRQSHISAYETGSKCPPLSTAIRLATAMGFDLEIVLKRPASTE